MTLVSFYFHLYQISSTAVLSCVVLTPATEQFIQEVCLGSSSRSCEFDPIPSFCLLVALILLPHIIYIMNTFLSSTFRLNWKSAVVRPFIKKPSLNQNCLSNTHQPRAFLCKILEKSVLFHLLVLVEQNRLRAWYGISRLELTLSVSCSLVLMIIGSFLAF